jgi:hypothetical protein
MAESKIEIRAVDKTAAAFRSVRGGLRTLGRQVLNARTALVGLAGVGGFGLLIKNAFESADALAKMSDRLGVSTERLAGLQHAASLAGVDFERVNIALRTSTRNVIDAAHGTGKAREAFAQLGFQAAQLAQLPIDEQFQRIGERLIGVRNVTERNALAMDIFGQRSNEVLNLFAEGGGALAAARDDVEKLGVALSRVDSAKIELANDAVERGQLVFKGLANTVAVHLAPVIQTLSDRFTQAAKDNNGFRDQVISGMERAAEAVALLSNVVQGLRFAWAGLKVAVGFALDFMIQGLADFDRQITHLQNSLADSFIGKKLGIEAAQYNQALQLLADVSANRLNELQAEMDAIALEGLPRERVRAWFAEVRAQAEQSAQAIAESRAGLSGADTGKGVGNQAALKKLTEFYDKRLEKLSESFLTENERLQAHRDEQLSLVNSARALEFLNEQEWLTLREEIELQHQAKLGNIHAQGVLARRQFEELNFGQKLKTVIGFGQQELAAVANSNKTLFRLHQAFALSEIAVAAPAAIAAAIERGGGLPWGAVFGALTAAKYIALAAQAASAKFSSSTSPSNVAGGAATPVTPSVNAVQPVPAVHLSAPPQSSVTVIVEGNFIGNREFIDNVLIPEVKEAIDNRDVVLIGRNSRQATELAPA